MGRRTLRFLFVTYLAVCSAAGLIAETDGIITDGEYAFTAEYSDGAYSLSWKTSSDTASFAMKARTSGWVALGIDPVQVMDQADMIFGWVDDSGKTVLLDAFSTGTFGPHPEDAELGGGNDITAGAGSERDGWTVIEFERRLNTGDRYDKPLAADREENIIWAYGPSDNFEEFHTAAGSAVITPGSGESRTVSRTPLVVFHAVFMILGFLLMASGIGLARYLKAKKWWLKVHKPIGVTGAVFSLIGVSISWTMVALTSGLHFRVIHSIVGAATLIVIIGTPILGQLMFSKSPRKQTYRRFHRWSGRTAMLFMTLTIILGLIQAGLLP